MKETKESIMLIAPRMTTRKFTNLYLAAQLALYALTAALIIAR
jgi:hypothetical protein